MDFDFTTETITPDATGILTIAGTGGLEISVGTTAERPVSPINGTIRYNSDVSVFEGYQAGIWVPFIGSGTGSVTSVGLSSVGANSAAITIGSSPVTSSGVITITSNLFSATTPGIVSQSGGGTSNFLRADGTWTTAPVTSVAGTIGNITASSPTGDVVLNLATAGTAGTYATVTTDTFGRVISGATTQTIATGGTGLTTLGTANQVLGVNASGTALEYKTVTAGTGVSVTNGAGSITIANTGVTSISGTANQIVASSSTGAVTLSISPNPVLPGTEGMVLNSGTTAERPISPTDGTIRFNTTNNAAEIYQNGKWYTLAGTTNGRGIINIYSGSIPASSSTVTVPWDNTAPLVTEGLEIWSRTVTPSIATSSFTLTVPFTVDCGTSNRVVITSLFRNSVNIGTALFFSTGGGRPATTTLSVTDAPGTLSPVVYTMRTGIGSGAGTWYINSTSTGNNLGGTLVSSYQITEVG